MQVTLFYQISLVKEVTYLLQLRRSLQFVSDCDIFIICISVKMSEAHKPCISPYLYYINWNLSNCSFALTDYDFECVFLMCDRKWYSMPSDERLDWKYKCRNDPKKFIPHPLLERLIRGVKGNAFDEHPPMCKHYKLNHWHG
ncbi:hypothetical protein T09_9367 [Trichinella sp. T9]|nr:hypothetical protein T09_9367 [Trichinella sp. T9]